ncbi:MAG: hypothetical protein Q8927_08095 [Bacteroidota bacterium]|nr:hypothetical protein [Bacteroidota bacterium]MDP4216149.1 hypothetical protein [Bacteroidota bacterium]MDP4246433.1 hypothetical protein [Bacteroidota bacterium]MDP4258563.1 hypothetical protein [Bacteroidota bacterium]
MAKVSQKYSNRKKWQAIFLTKNFRTMQAGKGDGVVGSLEAAAAVRFRNNSPTRSDV